VGTAGAAAAVAVAAHEKKSLEGKKKDRSICVPLQIE